MGKFWNFVRKVRPMFPSEKRNVEELEKYLEKKDLKKTKALLKTKRITFGYSSIGTTPAIIPNQDYPQVYTTKHEEKDTDLKEYINKVNIVIERQAKEAAFRKFSEKAEETIPKLIAPGITGFDHIKEAVSLQIFSTEKVHILLLGDPGTGKTDVLRSAAELSPISSLGLGSGTSGVGLSMMMRGGKVIKGLLPRADKGICCIDELNLMKDDDMAALYSAMEKGFIAYDKGDTHITLDARINVLATANPKGDKFVGWMLETIKKQLPFDSALMTRFHIVFLIRKPGVKEFEHIAKRIVEHQKTDINPNDAKFIREYIDNVRSLDVHIPEKIENEVVRFSKELKEEEDKFFVEINPRIVHGILRLCKASAKMNMRHDVNEQDFKKVKRIIEDSLNLKK